MRTALIRITIVVLNTSLLTSCDNKNSPTVKMVGLLSSIAKTEYTAKNSFCPEAKLSYYDSALHTTQYPDDRALAQYNMGNTYLELGDEKKAIAVFEELLKNTSSINNYDIEERKVVMKALAMARMREGERTNCIYNHTNESCILPISGRGVHIDKTSSEEAINLYKKLMEYDPNDLESRWLLNIAYMTTGTYPQAVPRELLIKGLDNDTSSLVKPFLDVAVSIGLNTENMAGGSIIDDFNNDDNLDLITSGWGLAEGMHYCRNNGDGTFTEASNSSKLKELTGGLNIVQTDYNNDGFKDIFVLRGAWKGTYGREPNSLLKNNGDGTFTDVTVQSGLLSFHPTQTATWADFNNDGWLDVFIGNETSKSTELHPCELYMSNKNGTFTEVATKAGCAIVSFVKGVTSGDYNNDGLPDIFISTLDGKKWLLKNEGVKNGVIHFQDVAQQAGLGSNRSRTFPTWFWDYDNDGWLDILVSGYEFNKSLAWYTAAEALNLTTGNTGKIFLFKNKHDGTFEDVSHQAGLDKIAFAMGANFGDIDNDGYLDMYLGTGNPQYQSLVPNKMFKNIGGKTFIDVTTSARVGSLQKGHGVSFADMDNDGDQDIYIEMGGAYAGDAYQNSLYINPGQTNNHWVNISLEGTTCNKAAIGAKIKVTFLEKGIARSVYRDVNSGGSFGSNPLLQHIGIGQASSIQSIEIKWPGDGVTQVFKNIPADGNIKIKEGNNSFTRKQLAKVDLTAHLSHAIGCSPE